MALLIDGYNLLHVTGLFGHGAPSFEASRQALLGFLAAAVDAGERERTTIVFDAAHAPPGLPDQYHVAGIHVRFARNYESADELLEELIAADAAPRKLVVVSSDHRVQRAAKKRRATAVDSDVWYRAASERLKQGRKSARELPDVKPEVPLTKGEVAVWLKVFGAIDVSEEASESVVEEVPPTTRLPSPPVKKKVASRAKAAKRAPARIDKQIVPQAKPPRTKKAVTARRAKNPGKPQDLGFGDIQNPFPPGYGEDVNP